MHSFQKHGINNRLQVEPLCYVSSPMLSQWRMRGGLFHPLLADDADSICLLIRGSWVRVPARSPPQTLIRQGFHHFRPASASLRDFSRVTPRVTADDR